VWGEAASAQTATVGEPLVVLSPAELRADFDVIRKSLEEAHGGFYRYNTPAELGPRLDQHRNRLDRPLSTLAFAGVLAETIAELRDGHLRLEFDSVTTRALRSARMLPLRFLSEGDRLIVLYNDSPADQTIRPGMELVSLNGRSASALTRLILPRISGDGFIETGRRSRLARELAQYYWLFVEQPAAFAITARDGEGRTVTATLPGVLERDRRTTTNPVNSAIVENSSKLDGPPGNVALEFIGDGAIARLRVRAFDGQAFPAMLDSAFRLLRDRGTKSLVLDLRGNGGGVDEYGALLVSYFLDKPFRYFDHIHVTTTAPSFATWPQRTFDAMRSGTVADSAGGFRVTPDRHKGVAEQPPASSPFLGKVAVLIDGATFSTAADVAAQLRSRDRATFLGEETGGGYEGNTSGLNALIILPHSKLRLRIMMYDYWNAVRAPAARGRGTIPDHVIVRRVSDLLRGTDPALERAVSLLR